jgi:transcriptional regulator with XRE-family HTH domain
MTSEAVPGIIPEFRIGDRLRRAREITGLDRKDFAAEVGVSRSTVSNVENGVTTPSRLVVRAWALRTGVPADWLETGMEKPRPGGPDGAAVRPKGFEPPTFWFGADGPVISADAGGLADVLPFRQPVAA